MPYLYHAKVSTKSDSTDSSLVRPTDWNARIHLGTEAGTGPSPTDAIIREVLQASRTYYVRADGSDSNNGLADTAAGAFLTIAHAMSVITTLDFNTHTVTLQLQNRTWTEPVEVDWGFGNPGSFIVDGGGGTIDATSLLASIINFAATAIYMVVQNVTLSGGSYGIYNGGLGVIVVGTGVTFGAVTNAQIYSTYPGAYIQVNTSYTISGGAEYHYVCLGTGSFIKGGSFVITMTGTPNFSAAFVLASRLALVDIEGMTFTGSATGVRYLAEGNGVIYTGGGGANYFPGDSAGSTNTGGQYL